MRLLERRHLLSFPSPYALSCRESVLLGQTVLGSNSDSALICSVIMVCDFSLPSSGPLTANSHQ